MSAAEEEKLAMDDDKLTPSVSPEADEARLPAIAFEANAGPATTGAHAFRRELTRELTQDERQLAAAGDEHLGRSKEMTKNEIDEHRLTPTQLANKLGTDVAAEVPKSKGLTATEAAARLARDGHNVLTPPPGKSAFRRYLGCLLVLFNILLILCGVLEYILLGVDFENNKANEYLGAILIAVAFLNAGIEFVQLQKSANILKSFLAMVPAQARVIRDGQITKIPAQDLVVGDLILVSSGDKVPADIFILQSTDFKVDNSSLTGESEPQTRQVVPEGADCRAVEAPNIAFNSSLVVNGEAYAVVIKTGDNTMLGSIAALTTGESATKSPLGQEIDHFVLLISGVAIFTAVLFFVVGITTTYKGKATSTVTFAISVLVAFVPQGLPATVTLLLSIAAQRMAKENVLVKDLQGVETLGSLTLLATDKTGTLTRNEMTVMNVWTNLSMSSAMDTTEEVEDEIPFHEATPGMKQVLDCAVLCSKIKFEDPSLPAEKRKIIGDATETGVAKFCIKRVADYDGVKAAHEPVFAIPFNSTLKFAATVVKKQHADGPLTLYLKGAPERILARCSSILINGELKPITDETRAAYNAAYETMAGKGHRVIATAQLLLPESQYPVDFAFSAQEKNVPLEGLTFIGLISLQDPPKHGVREAIGTLRCAGIQVIMVTGDHPLTAQSIARTINLICGDTRESLARRTGRPAAEIAESEYDAVVIHGDDIEKLEAWQWDQIFSKSEIVFARTSPQQKLEIVKRAQARGHIVGVTGDGVNDAPALKAADLGISMQISGSDVSKQAAKLILLDDNFSSVVRGVEEGRLIFANLKRAITYTLSHIIPEVIPQLLYVLVPTPLPLSAILILVIDLGFELAIGLSFAFDPPESREALMRQQPRKPVTANRLDNRRSRALRRIQTRHRTLDNESLRNDAQPTRLQKWREAIRERFTMEYWREAYAARQGVETLVNGQVLLYAYLFAGLIETGAVLVAYYVVFGHAGFSMSDLKNAQSAGIYFLKDSPDYTTSSGRVIAGPDQFDAFAQAQSIAYLSVFLTQCFNVFAVKAKVKPPFGRDVVANYWNFLGILVGAVIAMAIIYIPPFQTVFGGSVHLSPLWWLIPIAGGVVLLIMSTLRVLFMRRSMHANMVDPSKLGLRMFPTKRTLEFSRTISMQRSEHGEKNKSLKQWLRRSS